ncbi:hypothetical protein Tco_0167730 [Tanacetum coccineum]
MRNKSDLDTLSMDDLYNNLKVYEAEIKGQSNSSSNTQNMAFVSSENTSSTNEAVNTAHEVSTASSEGQASSSTYFDDVRAMLYHEEVTDAKNAGHQGIRDERRASQTALMANTSPRKIEEIIKESNSQISAKDKAGLGYDSQMNESEVVHSVFNRRESDVDDSPVNDRFKTGEVFHAILPPYTGNYMPSRPDLSFAGLDDSVYKTKVNEIETSISKISKDIIEKPKTVRPSAPIIEDWDTDSDNDSVFRPKSDQTKPKLTKINFVKSNENVKSVNKENTHRQVEYSRKRQVTVNVVKQSSPRAAASISTARTVNTTAPKSKVNDALPKTYSYFKAHSPVRRDFCQKSATKTNNVNEKVKISKVNNVTTARPKAVVSVAKGNGENAVKSSACWYWRPTGNVIDHTSKDSGSYMLKRFDYVDLQGRLKLSILSTWTCNIKQKCVKSQTPRQAKRGRDTKIPQSGAPPKKVGDEAVYKELGNRMEKAATTAYSLEVEQDNGPNLWKHLMSQVLRELVQFWQTASASTSKNEEMEITATIDGRVKTVTKASIRRHLKLEDSDGISTLSNTEIFEQLALMGVQLFRVKDQQSQLNKAASTGVDVRHGGAATTFTSLDAGQGSGNINKTPSMPYDLPLPRGHTLGSDEDRMQQHELMDLVTKLSDRCEALETDLRQTKKVYSDAFTRLIKKVKQLENTIKTSQARRRSRVVISDDEEEELEDPSKQGRMQLRFLQIQLEKREVVNVQSYTRRRRVVSTDSGETSTTEEPVSTVGASMPVNTAGMVQEASTPSSVATKDKGKAIMQESESPKKMKQREQIQISGDEEVALKLHEEFDAAERQRMDQVHQAAQGEKCSKEDIPMKLVELVNQRKKFFARQRAEAKRNKPMTPAQQKDYMSNYIKNQKGGYYIKQLKSLLFEQVKEIFEATMRRVQSFVPMDSELEDQRLKRVGQEVSKKPVKR